ncbi:hypothetical protein P3S67_010358 [Capsicum chacoense]
MTISKMIDSRLDVIKLYEEVMAMKGYNEEFLSDAFDYLVQSDTLAKAFMAKIKISVRCGWNDSSDNNSYMGWKNLALEAITIRTLLFLIMYRIFATKVLSFVDLGKY